MEVNLFLDRDEPVSLEVLRIHEYPLHTHKDIQIIYVLEGCIEVEVVFARYLVEKGDIHIINIDDIHGIKGRGDNVVLLLNINVDLYKDSFADLESRVFISYEDVKFKRHEAKEKFKYLLNIALEQSCKRKDNKSLADIGGQLLELFYDQFQYYSINYENRKIETARSAISDENLRERLNRIISGIYQSYNERTDIEKLAKKEHINKYYLSHFIKDYTGESYRDFVNMVRVEMSEIELLNTQKSISRISLECGFSNPQYYIKHFVKWFGITPSEFRRLNYEKTINYVQPEYEVFHDIDKYLVSAGCVDIALDAKAPVILKWQVVKDIFDGLINNKMVELNFHTHSFINMLGEDVVEIDDDYIITRFNNSYSIAIYGRQRQRVLIKMVNMPDEVKAKVTEIMGRGSRTRQPLEVSAKEGRMEMEITVNKGSIVVVFLS